MSVNRKNNTAASRFFNPNLGFYNDIGYKYRYVNAYKELREEAPSEKLVLDFHIKLALMLYLDRKHKDVLVPKFDNGKTVVIASIYEDPKKAIAVEFFVRGTILHVVFAEVFSHDRYALHIEEKKHEGFNEIIYIPQCLSEKSKKVYSKVWKDAMVLFPDDDLLGRYRLYLTDHIFKKRDESAKAARFRYPLSTIKDSTKFLVSQYKDKIDALMDGVIGEKKIAFIFYRKDEGRYTGFLFALSKMLPGEITFVLISVLEKEGQKQMIDKYGNNDVAMFIREERVNVTGFDFEESIRKAKEKEEQKRKRKEEKIEEERKRGRITIIKKSETGPLLRKAKEEQMQLGHIDKKRGMDLPVRRRIHVVKKGS